MSKRIQFASRLEQDTIDAIEDMAKRRKLTKTSVIERAIRDYYWRQRGQLVANQTFVDAFQDLEIARDTVILIDMETLNVDISEDLGFEFEASLIPRHDHGKLLTLAPTIGPYSSVVPSPTFVLNEYARDETVPSVFALKFGDLDASMAPVDVFYDGDPEEEKIEQLVDEMLSSGEISLPVKNRST